jgi:hypothetical protein
MMENTVTALGGQDLVASYETWSEYARAPDQASLDLSINVSIDVAEI